MNRHLLRHDPSAAALRVNLHVKSGPIPLKPAEILSHVLQKRRKPNKPWQKRLNGNQQPLVEENLRRLFTLRMRISRRSKVEADLSGLFNERKIPHYVDPEVNLRDLFKVKQSRPVEAPETVPVKC